jgi:hypothetical protein
MLRLGLKRTFVRIPVLYYEKASSARRSHFQKEERRFLPILESRDYRAEDIGVWCVRISGSGRGAQHMSSHPHERGRKALELSTFIKK